MHYFLAKTDRQLGICLRMLYAEGIAHCDVETVLNAKHKIEFHITIAETEPFEQLNAHYEMLAKS